MNKSEMIQKVKEKAELKTLAMAESAINAVFETIADTLAAGGEYWQPGFGKFIVKQYEVRIGRNPQTGEPLTIPARKNVKLKVSSSLEDRINKASK